MDPGQFNGKSSGINGRPFLNEHQGNEIQYQGLPTYYRANVNHVPTQFIYDPYGHTQSPRYITNVDIPNPPQYLPTIQQNSGLMAPPDMDYNRIYEDIDHLQNNNRILLDDHHPDTYYNVKNVMHSVNNQPVQEGNNHYRLAYNYSDLKNQYEYPNESMDYAASHGTRVNQPTLGQLAEQVQAKARAEAKAKGNIVHDTYQNINDDDDEELDTSLCDTGAEHTGRWTKEEHELFLEALKKFGKEWKKVAAAVKTRTVVQTRTHAQKYFQKLQKAGYSEDAMEKFTDSPSAASTRRHQVKRARHENSNTGNDSRKHVAEDSLDEDDDYDDDNGDYNTPHTQRNTPISSNSSSHNSSNNSLNSFSNVNTHQSTAPAPPIPAPTNYLPISIRLPSHTPSSSTRLDNNFPQPSPAACGKRKEAELAAAEMLAASAAIQDLDGAQTLSMMKSSKFISPADPSSESLYTSSSSSSSSHHHGHSTRSTSSHHLKPILSIINPDQLPSSSYDHVDNPETPWEKEVKRLENPSSPDHLSAVHVQTPSEQMDFLSRLREAVLGGNLEKVTHLLQAAELSVISKTNNNNNNNNLRNNIDESTSSTTTTSSSSSSSNIVSRTLNSLDSITGETILMVACSLLPPDHTETAVLQIVRALIDSGASASISDNTNTSCLHRVAKSGFCQVGRLLLNKGCSVNTVTSHNGDAATHIAASYCQEKFLELLAEFGANPHIRNSRSRAALDYIGYNLTKEMTEIQKTNIRKLILVTEPRLRTLILFHTDCLLHQVRRDSDWEGPDRLLDIMKRLQNTIEFNENEIEISNAFEKADIELLKRVHLSDYITFVNNLSNQVKVQQDNAMLEGGMALPPPPPLPFTPQVQKFVKNFNTNEMKDPNMCDTAFSSGTLIAARRAAGAVAHAVDRVLLGRNRNAFCVVRPPGHHAGWTGLLDGCFSCGFCIFNSVAAGALHALESHRCERVAIVDLDVHHGNGTEDIVRRYSHPSRLFFFSVHLFDKGNQLLLPPVSHPSSLPKDQSSCSSSSSSSSSNNNFHTTSTTATTTTTSTSTSSSSNSTPSNNDYLFYPGTGAEDDMEHNIINVPITPLWKQTVPIGVETRGSKSNHTNNNAIGPTGREAYRLAITQRLLPSLRAFNPDLILISAGFDAAAGDVGNIKNGYSSATGQPLRGMDLLPEDFEWVTTEVLKVADICCAGRVVSVLEGGYGEYTKPSKSTSNTSSSNASHRTTIPPSISHSSPPTKESLSTSTYCSVVTTNSLMDRTLLANSAISHIKRLVDPYGGTGTTTTTSNNNSTNGSTGGSSST